MASLERYAEARRRYPEAEMLMGIGNLTELTAADSTGVNALLIAICQELGIRTVLTTEVIPWARGAVREVDVARRLMHYAVTQHTIPKGVDDRLVTVKDPTMLTYTEDELRALQAGITDPNFRIFADRDGITVLNNERFVRGTTRPPGDIFAQLGVDEPTHAFYLGKELATRQPRRDARQDLPSGRRAVVGLSHAARRAGNRSARYGARERSRKPRARDRRRERARARQPSSRPWSRSSSRRPIRCAAASCSAICRIGCSSTARPGARGSAAIRF